MIAGMFSHGLAAGRLTALKEGGSASRYLHGAGTVASDWGWGGLAFVSGGLANILWHDEVIFGLRVIIEETAGK